MGNGAGAPNRLPPIDVLSREGLMSEFKSYRFGNVEVAQYGGWGQPYGWRAYRHNSPTGFEANSETDALRLGVILGSITDDQWHQFNCAALACHSKEDAA
jgi:hypothetical protein